MFWNYFFSLYEVRIDTKHEILFLHHSKKKKEKKPFFVQSRKQSGSPHVKDCLTTKFFLILLSIFAQQLLFSSAVCPNQSFRRKKKEEVTVQTIVFAVHPPILLTSLASKDLLAPFFVINTAQLVNLLAWYHTNKIISYMSLLTLDNYTIGHWCR